MVTASWGQTKVQRGPPGLVPSKDEASLGFREAGWSPAHESLLPALPERGAVPLCMSRGRWSLRQPRPCPQDTHRAESEAERGQGLLEEAAPELSPEGRERAVRGWAGTGSRLTEWCPRRPWAVASCLAGLRPGLTGFATLPGPAPGQDLRMQTRTGEAPEGSGREPDQ